MTLSIPLSNGALLPKLGLGTWQLEGSACRKAVAYALATGYRHIDTAEAYENEGEVGKGLKDSLLKRESIFLTSKVRREYLHHDAVIRSCEGSLERLGIDYLDLYLIHWPNRHIPLGETMQALSKLKERGLIRAIGVSNFPAKRIAEALEIGIPFEVNQIEYHPSLNQRSLKNYCDQNSVAITAYSPIAQGHDLKLPTILRIAAEYSCTPAQVILHWLIARGMAVLPRSQDPRHIEENFKATTIRLPESSLDEIDRLDQGFRVVNPRFAEFEA